MCDDVCVFDVCVCCGVHVWCEERVCVTSCVKHVCVSCVCVRV